MNNFTIRVDIHRALPPTMNDADNGKLVDSRDYHFTTERPHLLEILDGDYITTVSQAAAMHAELSAARSAVLEDLKTYLPIYTCAELFALDSADNDPVKLLAVMGEVEARKQ